MMGDNPATPPGDDQPPALPVPGGRVTRQYGPVERAGLIWLAVRDGVRATADRYDVPRSTITGWLEETNGAGPVQEWLCTETLRSFLKFEQDFYAEATRRLEKLPNDEFGMTLRKLIEARTGVLAAQSQDGQPAVAAAQATVTLQVTEKDGEISVIELGTPPEDTE